MSFARLGDDRLYQPCAASAVQVVLCAAAIVVAALAGDDLGSSSSRYALIVLLALAMGVQNATARRLAVAELTTTVVTITLTGIAAALADGPKPS